MTDLISQLDYDNAAAVFSRSFRFVEWRFVIAADRADGVPTPFGDDGQDRRKATVAIDREKWIYVFRTNTQRKSAALPALVEEIRIDKSGEMAATPHDDIDKPIKKRGQPVALGKTMCLPRRILGMLQVYRLFASRVRLDKTYIEELKKHVEQIAPPVIFDPDQNNSVIKQNGELLVPVVDPITVALHLHAAYCAAADDIVDYTTAHKDNKQRRQVERRRKKHVLAMLLKSIIGEKGNTAGDNLVHELKDMQFSLEDFLTHYNAQLQWRVERRDRLAMFLVRWLQAEALRVTAVAFKAGGTDDWVKFLVPWCRAVTRLSESAPGRKYLDKLADISDHFVHTYVWPEQELSGDAIQAVRKGGMTILEAWKSIVESRILRYKPTELAELAARTLGNLQRKLIWRGKYSFPPMGIKEGFAYSFGLRKAIEYQGLEAKAVEAVHDHFSNTKKSPAALIESVNLILAIMAYGEAMKGEDPRKKELALIGLLGSSLDAASALGSLLKNSEKVVVTMSFVSGVIDVYLAHQEMDSAFKDGDTDAANGAFVTGVGSAIGASTALMWLMGIPGGQIVAVIGLLIVAIGYLFKFTTSKGPIERFFAHCTWGKEYGQAGGGDWSPTRFEQWKGDNEFDHQFEALLNIICDFEISAGDTYRDLKFKMGWLPPDSKLLVKFEETWSDKADNRTLESEVLITHQGPRATVANMLAQADGKNGLKIAMVRSHLSAKDPHQGAFNKNVAREMNPDLQGVTVHGRLLVSMEGMGIAMIPHAQSTNKGWHKKTIYEV